LRFRCQLFATLMGLWGMLLPAGVSAAPAVQFDDDEVADTASAHSPSSASLPPELARLRTADISQRLSNDPASLGPLSVGWTNSGMVLNAVRLPASELYVIMDPTIAWATQETIDYLRRAIAEVHEQIPDTPRLYVGHLGREHGGHLPSHKSHQSGRDVDVDYYFLTPEHRFYRLATDANLDKRRSWALVRALVTKTDVEMIFINTSIQRLLKTHALSIGEDRDWLDSIFEFDSDEPNPIIRHARGHQTHIHIRFHSPIAQEMGRRAYPALVAMERIKPERYYASHRTRKGDTLGQLAARYDTTVEAIQRANRLKSTKIIAGRTYRIPKRGKVRPAPGPVRVPPRRLPPPAKPPDGAAGGHVAAPALTP